MSEARIDRIANENNTGGPTLSGITTFSGQQYFVPPSGNTAERPSDCPPGSIRFNTDSAHLEYWDGLQWLEFEASSNELGGSLTGAATTFSTNGTGTRGLSAGGSGPGGYTSNIQFFTFETLGNTEYFGGLSGGFSYKYGTASSTRGLWAGGYTGSPQTGIEYVTISSTGSAISFGSLTSGRWGVAACSNGTRGVFMGGTLGPGTITAGINNIEYVTISTTGLTAQDFGDLNYEPGAAKGIESSVRALCAGGYDDVANSHTNRIDFITMSSTGNATDFGDLITASYLAGAGSSATRGVFGGGTVSPTVVNSIDFVTMASTGNAQDFGDLTTGRSANDASSSKTRCVFIGGQTPTATDSIEYITIASTGNAQDFGDYSPYTIYGHGQISNGHGGL